MIYRLHRCTTPFDPNRGTYPNIEAFYDVHPAIHEYKNQIDAYRDICARWPDAVFMPVPVRIGSGVPVMLGVLENLDVPHDPTNPKGISFAALLHADAADFVDRKEIKRNGGSPFLRAMWRTPVKHAPSGALLVRSELRASDLEVPSRGQATMWRDGDRIVVHMEVGGGEVSVALDVSAEQLHAVNSMVLSR